MEETYKQNRLDFIFELTELFQLLDEVGATDEAVIVRNLLSDTFNVEESETSKVRFPDHWDLYTKLQSLIEDFTYLRADVDELELGRKDKDHVIFTLKDIVKRLKSDEFIQDID